MTLTVLESLQKNLKATNLYRLTGETMADVELSVYAQELDALHNSFDELERESFIAEASGRGLSMWEALYGLDGDGKSVEQRRSAVLGHGAVTANDFTRAKLEQIFLAEGLRVEIYENTAEQKVYINFLENIENQTERLGMLKIVQRFLPAHLDAELDFRILSWNTIDKAELSFNEIEAKALAWKDIDNYKNAVMPLDF